MKRSQLFRFALPLVAFATAVAFSESAFAQSDDTAHRAAAQALFDEAVQLESVRDYARACPKLEEVNNLQPGKIGAMLELAGCYEGWGKTASAWARYRAAADLAARANDKRKAEAEAKVNELGPKVSRLVVLVPDSMRGLNGLAIEIDATPLGQGAWGTSIPVDPGAHDVSASAPDKRKWSTKVEVNRPSETITVTIPALTEQPGANGANPQAAGTGSGAVGIGTASGWTAQHSAGIVMAGLGVVGFGIMAGFGVDAGSKHSASNAYCSADRKFCEPEGLTLEKQAHTSANVSTGTFVAGLTLVGAGVLVFVLAPSPKKTGNNPSKTTDSALSLRVNVGPSTAGAAIQGAF